MGRSLLFPCCFLLLRSFIRLLSLVRVCLMLCIVLSLFSIRVGYVAPEILRSPVSSGYTNNVDIFSAGVTLYVLLCGYEPFYGECDAELIASNRKASIEYPVEDWRKSKFKCLIVDCTRLTCYAEAAYLARYQRS